MASIKTIKTISGKTSGWKHECLQIVEQDGVVIVDELISKKEAKLLSEELEKALVLAVLEIGEDVLHRAGERGIVRCPFIYSDVFFQLFANNLVQELVSELLDPAAICHLQNGIVLKPKQSNEPLVFQENFHRDFPRYLNGYRASVNTFFCLTDFSIENGGTRFLLGSHQNSKNVIPNSHEECIAIASSGSTIIFDSTIWHAGGLNQTKANRNAINIQWTRSFIKQQIDLVRLIDPKTMIGLPQRSQQLLGYYTRIPTILNEYYVPPEERFYRSGQG